jgi:NodT family efflux transporter outer membrane factor (OMF) lipoprotein
MTPAYKEQLPAPGQTSGWKLGEPRDAEGRSKWWEAFGDPELNALEERINPSNQTLALAEAQFRGARAAVRTARSGLFPAVTGGASVTGSQVSGTLVATRTLSVSPSANLQIPFDASYEADFWGRIHGTIDAGVGIAQATAADLETLRLAIQAELAANFFRLHGLDAERNLLDSTVAAYQKALELTTNRYNQGVSSRVDVVQAETQLETTRAQATDTGLLRAQYEHAIATLIGEPPAAFSIAPSPIKSKLPSIPVGLPAELLERRPDIASAERHMAASNAAIGVSRAAFFPTVTFSLAAGLESSNLGDLFTWPSRFWSLGPELAQILFDAGRRRSITDQARASYDASVAAYRQNVLAAFQEVEDNLSALRILRQEDLEQAEAIRLAERSLALAINRYQGGITTYLEVITAQSAALANERAGVELLTRRMMATVQLIKALGGGWEASSLPSARDLGTK